MSPKTTEIAHLILLCPGHVTACQAFGSILSKYTVFIRYLYCRIWVDIINLNIKLNSGFLIWEKNVKISTQQCINIPRQEFRNLLFATLTCGLAMLTIAH